MINNTGPKNVQVKRVKNSVADFEKMVIAAILKANNGNVQESSDILEIGKTALYARIKRYKLS